MQQDLDTLERELGRLSRAIVYPPAPALPQTVARRLAPGQQLARPRRRWAFLGAGIAAMFFAGALAIAAISPAREAVADLFDRINIFQTEKSPEGLPTEVTGTPLTLEEAEARLGVPIQLPSYPEGLEPQRVLFQDFGRVKAAVLFFEHPSGTPFALFETNAGVGKGLPTGGGTAEAVPGFAGEAYWLEGLRIVEYYDLQGNVIPESIRATDVNTLIWAEDGLVFRLEGNLLREEAVRIAQSLR